MTQSLTPSNCSAPPKRPAVVRVAPDSVPVLPRCRRRRRSWCRRVSSKPHAPTSPLDGAADRERHRDRLRRARAPAAVTVTVAGVGAGSEAGRVRGQRSASPARCRTRASPTATPRRRDVVKLSAPSPRVGDRQRLGHRRGRALGGGERQRRRRRRERRPGTGGSGRRAPPRRRRTTARRCSARRSPTAPGRRSASRSRLPRSRPPLPPARSRQRSVPVESLGFSSAIQYARARRPAARRSASDDGVPRAGRRRASSVPGPSSAPGSPRDVRVERRARPSTRGWSRRGRAAATSRCRCGPRSMR